MFLPSMWVKHILKKHGKERDDLQGTGGELAQHLINRFELEEVTLETTTEGGDCYNHGTKTVHLSPSIFDRKSLSAIAVATHEVGHAIQFERGEPLAALNSKYLQPAYVFEKWAKIALTAFPLLFIILPNPRLLMVWFALGVATMLIRVAAQFAVLPLELDASFNKALPILKQGGYLQPEDQPAVEQVLKAAAYTYVAAALANVLNIGRWFWLFRGLR